MSDYRLSRRDLLRSATLGAGALGISALATACGGSEHGAGSTGTDPAGSLRALAAGATQLSLLAVQGEGARSRWAAACSPSAWPPPTTSW
jgi:hypothetical protein